MSAAKQLNNELFQESWTSLNAKNTKDDAIVSYLMVEEVNPPDYIWNRIIEELDKPINSNTMTNSSFQLSKKATITALIFGGIIAVAAILYFLL